MAHATVPLNFNAFLEKAKLKDDGSNNTDWVHNLRIILIAAQKNYVMEACNTPHMIFPICTPTLAVSDVKLFYFLGFGFFCLRVLLLLLSCISYHVIMCIAFAYVFISCI